MSTGTLRVCLYLGTTEHLQPSWWRWSVTAYQCLNWIGSVNNTLHILFLSPKQFNVGLWGLKFVKTLTISVKPCWILSYVSKCMAYRSYWFCLSWKWFTCHHFITSHACMKIICYFTSWWCWLHNSQHPIQIPKGICQVLILDAVLPRVRVQFHRKNNHGYVKTLITATLSRSDYYKLHIFMGIKISFTFHGYRCVIFNFLRWNPNPNNSWNTDRCDMSWLISSKWSRLNWFIVWSASLTRYFLFSKCRF